MFLSVLNLPQPLAMGGVYGARNLLIHTLSGYDFKTTSYVIEYVRNLNDTNVIQSFSVQGTNLFVEGKLVKVLYTSDSQN